MERLPQSQSYCR